MCLSNVSAESSVTPRRLTASENLTWAPATKTPGILETCLSCWLVPKITACLRRIEQYNSTMVWALNLQSNYQMVVKWGFSYRLFHLHSNSGQVVHTFLCGINLFQHIKGKGCHISLECRWAAHLPFIGLEPMWLTQ